MLAFSHQSETFVFQIPAYAPPLLSSDQSSSSAASNVRINAPPPLLPPLPHIPHSLLPSPTHTMHHSLGRKWRTNSHPIVIPPHSTSHLLQTSKIIPISTPFMRRHQFKPLHLTSTSAHLISVHFLTKNT